jgi:hypothetical protein
VKDWLTTVAILVAHSTSLTLADDFRTIRGKEYKDATVRRVESDGIVLKTKTGIVKLYFSELPKEVQERVHRDTAKTTTASSSYQTPMNIARPSALPAAIEKLQRRGFLRLDCGQPDAKVWIASAAWRTFDAEEKENIAKNLAAHCHPQSPSIWILDKQSGRNLASYGPSRGFKTY